MLSAEQISQFVKSVGKDYYIQIITNIVKYNLFDNYKYRTPSLPPLDDRKIPLEQSHVIRTLYYSITWDTFIFYNTDYVHWNGVENENIPPLNVNIPKPCTLSDFVEIMKQFKQAHVVNVKNPDAMTFELQWDTQNPRGIRWVSLERLRYVVNLFIASNPNQVSTKVYKFAENDYIKIVIKIKNIITEEMKQNTNFPCNYTVFDLKTCEFVDHGSLLPDIHDLFNQTSDELSCVFNRLNITSSELSESSKND